MESPRIVRLTHMRLSLALHRQREGEGLPLLMLHGLGEKTLVRPPGYTDCWPGPVHGLDFTGHGGSDIAVGGGYTSEALIGDVDMALAHLGEAALVGRGLGAYVALLTSAARPEHVRGLILADGPGIDGAGPAPTSTFVMPSQPPATTTPDPVALAELAREVRPPELVEAVVRHIVQAEHLAGRVIVASVAMPPWLQVATAFPGVKRLSLPVAVAELASTVVACGTIRTDNCHAVRS